MACWDTSLGALVGKEEKKFCHHAISNLKSFQKLRVLEQWLALMISCSLSVRRFLCIDIGLIGAATQSCTRLGAAAHNVRGRRFQA